MWDIFIGSVHQGSIFWDNLETTPFPEESILGGRDMAYQYADQEHSHTRVFPLQDMAVVVIAWLPQ